MSSEESSVWLPLTPSLLEILSYLTYNDVCNARLVNKRMNDVIKRNEARWDRPTVSLSLTIDHERASGKMFVYLDYYLVVEVLGVKLETTKHLCRFCITEKRIRLIDFPPAMLECLLEKASTLPYGTMYYGDRAALEQLDTYKQANWYQDFAIDSIEEGLRLVLQILFRRFFFFEFKMISQQVIRRGVRSAHWVEIVREEFAGSRSSCQILLIDKQFFGMERLYTTIGSSVTLSNTVKIEAILLNQRFDRIVNIYKDVPLALLVELIQRWTSGLIPSIKGLYITTSSQPPYPIDNMLLALQSFQLVFCSSTASGFVDCLIKRDMDEKALWLLCHEYGKLQVVEGLLVD